VLLVLYLLPDEHASLVNRGFSLSALWAGVQAVAVLLAESTGRFFFRCSNRRHPEHPTCVASGLPAVIPGTVIERRFNTLVRPQPSIQGEPMSKKSNFPAA
jgi:hypothetical protein